MTSPYAGLRQIVIPLDESDRAQFEQQARFGRYAVGCMAVLFGGFFCVFASASSGPDGPGAGFLVPFGLCAFGFLGLLLYLLRPGATPANATKTVYRGVLTGTRTVVTVEHTHAHVPATHDHAMHGPTTTESTRHLAALDGVEFTVPGHLVPTLELGRTYDFHALREGDVFRITPAPV